MAFKDEIRGLLGGGAPALTRIIAINVLIFIAANIYVNIAGSEYLVDRYLALPANFHLFFHQPWTIVTYMFLHINLWHILFNMLWLWWMGRLFVEYMGEKRLVYTYIIGGIAGGLLFMLTFGLALPQPFVLMGASAGIMAVIVAIAGLIPEYTVFLFLIGPVRLKYVAFGIFLITSILDFSENSGGKISHIGGAVYGLIYVWQYRKGNDFVAGLSKFFKGFTKMFRTSKRAKLTSTRGGRSMPDKQKRIDDILDKISKSGYESLSKEEKDFLFKSSKES
jgi:membrane associated rhomboid family serine protease